MKRTQLMGQNVGTKVIFLSDVQIRLAIIKDDRTRQCDRE